MNASPEKSSSKAQSIQRTATKSGAQKRSCHDWYCSEKSEYSHPEKAWCPIVKHLKQTPPTISLKLLGYAPQAYHKNNKKKLFEPHQETLISRTSQSYTGASTYKRREINKYWKNYYNQKEIVGLYPPEPQQRPLPADTINGKAIVVLSLSSAFIPLSPKR